VWVLLPLGGTSRARWPTPSTAPPAPPLADPGRSGMASGAAGGAAGGASQLVVPCLEQLLLVGLGQALVAAGVQQALLRHHQGAAGRAQEPTWAGRAVSSGSAGLGEPVASPRVLPAPKGGRRQASRAPALARGRPPPHGWRRKLRLAAGQGAHSPLSVGVDAAALNGQGALKHGDAVVLQGLQGSGRGRGLGIQMGRQTRSGHRAGRAAGKALASAL